MTVASSTSGIVEGNYILIGSEIMLVSSSSGATIGIIRGQLNTTAATHANGAAITIPAVDYIYFSVTANGNVPPGALPCTGACLYSAAVGTASGAIATSVTAPTNGVAEGGGTSGIIIDNDSTTQVGAEQIYFSTLNTGATNSAIQASQSAP
jgi:hypothetical protein